MDDSSLMPFGKHKGEKMVEVPDNYLMWFWRENKDVWLKNSFSLSKDGCAVMDYIRDCFDGKDL